MNTPIKKPFVPNNNNNNRQGGGGGYNRGGNNRYSSDNHRINHRINAREVRVISEEGEQFGILGIRQALELAESRDMDLVEVSPNAQPPVCKIMDYGKFKYREQKKEAEAKKKRVEVELKELRIRYRTDKGDLETKIKHAREFITEGDKVKFSMQFKGREAMYLNLGVEKFNEIQKLLEDIAVVDERSPSYGKKIHIVFAPIKKSTQPGGQPAATKPAQNKPATVMQEKLGQAIAKPATPSPVAQRQEPAIEIKKSVSEAPKN